MTVLPHKNGVSMILTNPRERSRFLRFAMVGIVGSVVDFGIFNLLTTLANFRGILASTISFIAAVLSNFFWNRYWTYPDSRSKHIIRQLIQFGVVSVAGLAIRVVIFAILENPLVSLSASLVGNDFFFKPKFIGYNATLAFAILVVMLWNFFINRYWTYNDVE